ncbi:MAG: hypothetical protein NXI27_08460 [Alphaproteobacteria bacterium]|nr:hypothetical protein [Alphaproteobacteria bacterium]
MRILFACFAMMLILATASQAQIKSSGAITGTVDGEKIEWDTLEMPGQTSTTTYSEWSPGNVSVTVQGHVGGVFGLEKSLSITFTLRDDGSTTDAALLYLPSDNLSDYYEAEAGTVVLELSPSTTEGDALVLSGSVRGTLTRTKREGLKFNVDKGDQIDIEATFESRALPEQ